MSLDEPTPRLPRPPPAGTVDSLLFVAHQEQILRQSRSAFRHVMGDGTFGGTLVGGQRPQQWRHVFASVQSVARLDLADPDPARFDMVNLRTLPARPNDTESRLHHPR